MRTPVVRFLATCVCCAIAFPAAADLVTWQTTAAGITGNVTASTNSGSGWSLDGTSGVAYDFGDLEPDLASGSSVEFIFNYTDNRASIALGTVGGWSPGNENNVFKLEQWNNTGKYGITIAGIVDYTLTTDSTFSADTHVVFVRNGDGTMDMYLNGNSPERMVGKTNWRLDGGPGYIGSGAGGTGDLASGTAFAVASYSTALTGTDVTNLYNAYVAVPEPAGVAVAATGLSFLVFLRRRLG